MSDDDDRAAEWADDAPTRVDTVPEDDEPTIEIDDRAATIPRCAECLAPVMTAGPIPPTSADGARFASPETCLRGKRWTWCASHGRLSLWAD